MRIFVDDCAFLKSLILSLSKDEASISFVIAGLELAIQAAAGRGVQSTERPGSVEESLCVRRAGHFVNPAQAHSCTWCGASARGCPGQARA